MLPIEDVRALIRERSTLPAGETEAIIAKRFEALPKRLVDAADHWPLERSRVLDVGCSYGHCLVHFAPGSVGLDNVAEHVQFCRSLGLDARLHDVEAGLDGLDDNSFDFVWVSDVLEHLDAPRVLLRRLRRKLKPDGRLVVYMSVLPRSRLLRRVFAGRGFFDASVHSYQFSVETARYFLERSGYAVEEVVVHGLPGRLAPVEKLLVANAPVVFFAARKDEAAEARALAAERRNKGDVSAVGGRAAPAEPAPPASLDAIGEIGRVE